MVGNNFKLAQNLMNESSQACKFIVISNHSVALTFHSCFLEAFRRAKREDLMDSKIVFENKSRSKSQQSKNQLAAVFKLARLLKAKGSTLVLGGIRRPNKTIAR